MFTVDSLLHLDWPRLGSSLKHLVLPAVTLALLPIAIISRLIRSSMLEALGKDYVRTARSKGISEQRVIYRHALRNALLPVVTSLGMLFGTLLGGVFLVEVVYTFPGLGLYVLDSILRAESAPIVSATLVVATLYMLSNLAGRYCLCLHRPPHPLRVAPSRCRPSRAGWSGCGPASSGCR